MKFLFYIKSFINNKNIYYLATLFHVKVTMSMTSQIPCRFFLQGNCTRSDCQYLHIQLQDSVFCQYVAFQEPYNYGAPVGVFVGNPMNTESEHFCPVQSIDFSDFGNSMKGNPDACQTLEYCLYEQMHGICSCYDKCPFLHTGNIDDEKNDTGVFYGVEDAYQNPQDLSYCHYVGDIPSNVGAHSNSAAVESQESIQKCTYSSDSQNTDIEQVASSDSKIGFCNSETRLYAHINESDNASNTISAASDIAEATPVKEFTDQLVSSEETQNVNPIAISAADIDYKIIIARSHMSPEQVNDAKQTWYPNRRRCIKCKGYAFDCSELLCKKNVNEELDQIKTRQGKLR